MPQITRTKIAPRLANRSFKQEGILSYDVDNLYPQRMQDIVNTSGTTKTCVELYAKFIEGNGFKDQQFYKLRVNANGLTNDKLLRKTTTDFANRNGFAIHVNYNANHKIVNLRPVQFKDCRLVDEENTDHAGQIAIYDDWARCKRANIKKDKIQFFDRFNPDPVIIEQQVEKAGGWPKWGGQVLWFSIAGDYEYPLAKYDPVIEDSETDGRIKNHKRKKSANGWNADFGIATGRFEKDADRQAFLDNLSDYQGDENDGDIPLIEFDKEEQIPKILEFPKSAKDSDFYTANETSVQTNIRKRFNIPGVLIGEAVTGKLGLSTEMKDAYAVYSGLTNQERRIFEETFKMLFDNWVVPNVNPSGDYSIIPLSYVSGDSEKPLAVQFGVGGTQAVQSLLSDVTIQPPQKINTLIVMFGLTRVQAEAMVNGTPLPENDKPTQ